MNLNLRKAYLSSPETKNALLSAPQKDKKKRSSRLWFESVRFFEASSVPCWYSERFVFLGFGQGDIPQ